MVRIAEHARDYFKQVKQLQSQTKNSTKEHQAKQSLLNVDAEVLRLYEFSPKLERQLLDIFAGHQRTGVPFRFDRYYPEDFKPWLHLHEFLSKEFQNSRASKLLESHKSFDRPEVSEALRRATKDFEE